jgi:NADPH:quinone reductase
MSSINRKITLAARPKGFPKESDFKLVEEPVGEPADGEVLIRLIWLSVDPYMRGRMNDRKSYAPPVQLGQVMGGGAVGKVLESKHPNFKPGDIVMGDLGWQTHSVRKGQILAKVDPSLAPISTAVGILGMPGMTAYFGLLDICDPKPGETLFVSGAAGAVGSLVGQIGKIKGCRVVGSAGSDEKVRLLTDEFGFDAAFNYKTTKDYVAKLAELCPKGIDCYFDNVGGEITDAVMILMNPHARLSICGHISMYNAEKPETGPRLLALLIERMAKMQGFIVSQYFQRFPEAQTAIAGWLAEGKIHYRETVTDGIENAPAAFIGMLQGENIGKQLVRVSDE